MRRMKPTRRPRGARASGISLLESMIAIVLLALGVLAILGVQLRTLADTQTSVRRAQAIRLIEDLSERMRINPGALTEGVLIRYTTDWGDPQGTVPDCSAGCKAVDLARSDMVQWKRLVQATLPAGDAAVFTVADPGQLNNIPQLGVMIAWRENERADADAAFRAPLTMPATGTDGASCPAERICHLQYLQPPRRCSLDGGPVEDPQLLCP